MSGQKGQRPLALGHPMRKVVGVIDAGAFGIDKLECGHETTCDRAGLMHIGDRHRCIRCPKGYDPTKIAKHGSQKQRDRQRRRLIEGKP